MKYRNLIRDHVVNLILSYPTHCTFINYGGKEDGIKELQSRIMKSFDVPETGYLQSCYVGNHLSVKKVFQLISELVSRDQLDKVIDLWKEICNQQHDLSSDLRLVGYLQEIELVGIRNGYSSYQFLNIVAPTLKYSSHAKVEEFITSAMDYAEKAIDAKTATGCEYYIEKLKRVLVSYPFIQTKFIVEKFGQDFLDELSELNSSEVRANTLWSKLKELNEYKMKKSVTDSNKDLPVNEEVKTNQPEEAAFDVVMTQESLSADNVDQSLSLPDYPNLAEEETPVEDLRYLAMIKELYPDVYAEIKETGDSSYEGVNAILLKKITKINQQRKVEDRINLIEQLSDKLSDQFKVLMAVTPFDPSGECKNPNCRVHNKNSKIIDLLRQHQNPIDNFIGIDLETRPSQVTQLKFRQPHPFDAFLTQTPSEHTASEIETTSNVVINQKFIIYDANGDFFSEYKMTWSNDFARIMLSHDKPGNGVGRQFRHLENLSGKMTQDEAFSRFQSLRRVSFKNPIKPRPNPFGGPVEDDNLQQAVSPTEPAIGTEMVSRVIIIDNNRHELMFNTVTKRLTIFGAGKQIYSGIVKNEYQSAYVWEHYKAAVAIDGSIHAINAAIAQLNGL